MNKPDIIKRIKQWRYSKMLRWPKRCDSCGEVPTTLYRNPSFGHLCGHCLEVHAERTSKGTK